MGKAAQTRDEDELQPFGEQQRIAGERGRTGQRRGGWGCVMPELQGLQDGFQLSEFKHELPVSLGHGAAVFS